MRSCQQKSSMKSSDYASRSLSWNSSVFIRIVMTRTKMPTTWWDGSTMVGQPPPIAYLRILYPQNDRKLPRIGRVLTHPNFRGKGVGREIMTRCLFLIKELYPESPVSYFSSTIPYWFLRKFRFSYIFK